MRFDIIIRKSNINDAEGRGYVHHQSWIETYTGLVSEEIMRQRSLKRSIQIAHENPENTYVAIINNKIVGFATYAKSRDQDLKDAGEIMAIYVLKDYQGFKIGKRLMQACYKELSEHNTLLLWVMENNRNTVKFYESEGFKHDGSSKIIYEQRVIRMVKTA